MADGQQITDLAGTLDGQGHVITLSGKALAENVSGTIRTWELQDLLMLLPAIEEVLQTI